MRKLTIIVIALFSASLFLNAACNRRNNGNNTNCGDALCTAIFASVTVHVSNTSGQPVVLDDAYTVRKKTGEKIRPEQNMADGGYNVLDDNYRSIIANTSEQFEFIGIKNGVQVVDESYTISADCCHVNKVSGRDSVTVNP